MERKRLSGTGSKKRPLQRKKLEARNAKGHFLPGNKGGPGNPHLTKKAKWLAAWNAGHRDPAKLAQLRKILWRLAVRDEKQWAIKLMMEYTLGKPKTMPDFEPVDVLTDRLFRNAQKSVLKQIRSGTVRVCRELNPSVIEEFCGMILGGMPHDGACDALGISHERAQDWEEKGREFLADPDANEEYEMHGRFVQAVRRAEAMYRSMLLKHVGNNEQAALSVLERRDPGSFGKDAVESEDYTPDEKYL